MKGKLFYVVVFLIGYTTSINSQEFTLTGRILDTLDQPLPYANIIANPVDSLATVKYTISNDDGFYSIKLLKNATYQMEIGFLGYKSKSFNLRLNGDLQKDVRLTEEENLLEEVVIELPITRIGDTIRYNTEKFVTGEERVLKDVLKNLPGIEVSKESEIFFNGRKVSEVLVENKTFFNGDSKLAVNNLPSNVVDKIELLENYNEVSFLKQLGNSEELALNIKLNKKNFFFGNLNVRKGNDDFYEGKSNLFYYSPATVLNSIVNFNNIGKQAFTLKDYLTFNGGVNSIFDRNFDFNFDNYNSFIESENFVDRNQKFAAVNIIKNNTKNWDISSYLIYSKIESRERSEQLNFYTEFFEDKQSNERKVKDLYLTNLKITYNPSSTTNIDFKSLLKFNDLDYLNNINSVINDNQNIIDLNENSKTINLNQSFELHSKINTKHTISFSQLFSYDNNMTDNLWSTNGTIFNNLDFVDPSQEEISILQDRNSSLKNFNLTFKHFWLLNRNNHVYTTLSNNNLSENLLINENQTFSNNRSPSLLNENNQLEYFFNDLSIGVHYKFKKGIFSVKPGLFFHQYNWSVNNLESIRKNQRNVLPEIQIITEFNRSKKLTFRYNLQTSFANSYNLINQSYLKSYNSIFIGNPNLDGELFNSFKLNYSSNSLYRGLSLFGDLKYTQKIEGYRNVVRFDSINQSLSPVLFSNASEDIIFRSHIYKKIKKIQFKFNNKILWSNFKQPINDQLNINESFNYSLDFSLLTFFKKFPNIETGINNNWRTYRTSSETSNFYVRKIFFQLEYDFLKEFIFNFNYDNFYYKSIDFNQNNFFTLLSTSLNYKKENSPFSFDLNVSNILNTEFQQSNSLTDYVIRDSRSFILPRIIIFGVQYNF